MKTDRLQRITHSLRRYRHWHRRIGLVIVALLLLSAVTGLLLSWKKQSEWLQPGTRKGAAASLSAWLPLDTLAHVAVARLRDSVPDLGDYTIDRMDVRPGKGVVKVRFERGYWEVQVDGATAEVKSVARRNADWIEHIHDGSIVSEGFKLLSMNVLGLGAVLMVGTGLWLWLGPRRFRKLKRRGAGT